MSVNHLMFDHVTIRVSDLAASKRFDDLVFAAIESEGEPFVGEDVPRCASTAA